MKYVKKSEIVEVVQWVGDNFNEIAVFCGNLLVHMLENTDSSICIHREDNITSTSVIVKKDDWIVRDINGTYHVYNTEKFVSTFLIYPTQ